MSIKDLIQNLWPFIPLFFFILSLFIAFFLNYISTLYSEVDLFKVDLAKKGKSPKIKKLLFVLKNNQILFAMISFLQVILNIFMSVVFLEKIDESFFNVINKYLFFFLLGFFIALFTEVFARYLGSKPFSRELVQSNFFLDFAYLLVRPVYFLSVIVKPKKKIFINSEQDVIRFINNLSVENVLEKKEAQLVQSAFNFDESRVSSVLSPWKKVIFLNENMTYEEVKKLYHKYLFTRYPVLDENKELIGVFNLAKFYWMIIKNKGISWQSQIDKKPIFVSPHEKIDKIFEKLQTNYRNLAIVRFRKNLLGIVTSQDILNSLVGKMRDEKDVLRSLSFN